MSLDALDDYVISAQNECDFESNEMVDNHVSFPTTDASDLPYIIEEKNDNNKKDVNLVSSHVMLNMNGTVLSRKKHQINPSSLHKFFLQKL